MGIAFDVLTTNRGVEIEPVKFTAGKNFAGVANSGSASAADIKAVAKGYKLGESHGFDVRISAPAASGAVQFQWKESAQSTYSAPQDLHDGTDFVCTQSAPCELKDNGKINGQTATGVYIYASGSAVDTDFEAGNVFSFYHDHQEGRAYEYGNSNNAHQQVECSGRGACDRGSGRCECFPGFNGEACQRTMCPNDCSGHGVCQDQRRFASDAGETYATAYDAKKQMGCMCDDGFRGPDCSQIECPSGADPMGHYGGDGENDAGATGAAMDCSGRGLCDYSSGSCSCFKGYFGERCEYQTNFV
jgi:hypothetical protein